ncbi:MAG: PEP-CTERM sorting domain-containing protein [Acetobacteraceae bacterium]|nr:PEP-CTERM sorting domain-containing protein [Acetobacteraceae bacterium]
MMPIANADQLLAETRRGNTKQAAERRPTPQGPALLAREQARESKRRSRTVRLVTGLVALSTATLVSGPGRAAVINTITANGYTFTNFDPPVTAPAVGSNANGISNAGQVVGTEVDVNNASTFTNFSGVPSSTTFLNTGAGQIAFGINTAGNVVGGNGTTAFYLPAGGSLQPLATPAGAINAFGINDQGNIVGQFTTAAGTTPGFFLANIASTNFTTINAPSGPNVVNAQGANNNGLIVGFYLGTDGQVHGFRANAASAVNNVLTGTAIADPVIPTVPAEPGATFVFSQILGVNDGGLASGYYGDSTTSQHGFLFNTNTGTYTFLDDPSAAFHNGVEITQITGIANSGELAGFYTDGQGIAHSFVACPSGVVCPGTGSAGAVPEPASLALLGAGVLALVGLRRRMI